LYHHFDLRKGKGKGKGKVDRCKGIENGGGGTKYRSLSLT